VSTVVEAGVVGIGTRGADVVGAGVVVVGVS
jgi:hypothetical protein